MAFASHLQNNVQFSWDCPLTKTGKRSAHSTCAKSFAQEMGFQLIETSDDGNCFFYTLSKFAKRSNYAPLLLDSNEHRNARLLREQLVNHIEENFQEYIAFLSNNNNNLSPENQIRELRENGAWASSAGDLVPFAGANAFGININLYNILVLEDGDVVQLNQIRPQNPSSVFVSIMRVREGHFQLLWPRTGQFESNQGSYAAIPVSSSSSSSSSTAVHHSPKKDAIQAAYLAVKAAQIAVSAVKQNSNSPSSIGSNEKKLNQMIQHLNQLSISSQSVPNASFQPRRSTRSTRSKPRESPPRSPPKPRRTTRSTKRVNRSPPSSFTYANNNNNELRRAIEESMRYQ
jgi:hypothetical protein